MGYRVGSGREDLSIDRRDSAFAVPKSCVSDISFSWDSDRPPGVTWSDTVIYETHVRGATMMHPDIPANLRGTFLGLSTPVMVDYLQELGITTIELLPAHALTDDRTLVAGGLRNYWGYNTIGFFAPDTRYLSAGEVWEFQTMVRRFHQAGIEVILDVVYNHTAEGNQLGPTLSFRGIDNASYYRLIEGEPRFYVNDTGCGNTLNLSHPRVLQMVLDSLRHWVQVMGVDGFRFDLATTLAREPHGFDHGSGFLDAVRQDPVPNKVKLIAEPWDVGPGGYRLGAFPPGFAEWNDRYRDTVRRYWRGDEGMLPAMTPGMLASADLFEHNGRRPWASINFITSHDGFTLHDVVSYEAKHNEANGEENRDGHDANYSRNYGVEGPTDDPAILDLRERQKRNLLATLLLSQGTPMLLAGDEIGSSQNGNNNAYCQDNQTGWIDWNRLDDRATDLREFVRRLLRFRKAHRVFRQTAFLHGTEETADGFKDVTWLTPDGEEKTPSQWNDQLACCIGLMLSAGDRPSTVLVIMNAHDQSVSFTLPEAPAHAVWRREIDTGAPALRGEAEEPLRPGTGYPVPGRSVLVFSLDWAAPRRPSGGTGLSESMQQDTALLDRLAGRAGIALSYHSIDGTLQVVGDDSKRALLAAMGFDAGSDAAIAAALAELDAENERPLPPVLIAAEARGITVPLNLPSGHSTSPIDWTVETEEGDTISGRATPGEDGQTALQLRFEPVLPCGYHQLALDLPDGLTSTRLIVAPPRAFGLPDLGCSDRVWGVAAPLYGLRSSRSWGIGDFADLDVLVESAAEAGAALVGINPVHALFPSQPARISPYSPSSRLFLNPLHIALDAVPVKGAAESGPAGTLAALAAVELVDYPSAAALKFARLDALYARFNTASGAEPEIKASFDAFVRAHSVPLYRHALFEALSENFNGSWQDWPAAYRSPDTPEVDAFAEQNVERIDRACFAQWLTEYQLAAVQGRALQRGMPIGLYGDLAVGVDPEGADAWAMPEVHARGVSLGAPPDKFSPAGQEWGLAPLLPGALRETGYDLFIAVLQGAMRHVGALRIDHALGLERCFWVPADGAAAGSYVHYPVDDLLAIIRLESHRNRCVVIGEDLGNVPRMLRAALTESGLLGYRVFDFERDHDGSFRPVSAYPPASLASATTHDLPTSRGY